MEHHKTPTHTHIMIVCTCMEALWLGIPEEIEMSTVSVHGERKREQRVSTHKPLVQTLYKAIHIRSIPITDKSIQVKN